MALEPSFLGVGWGDFRGKLVRSIAEKSCLIQVFSDPEAGQDEIVSHRVAGGKLSECLCDFYGRTQVRLLSLCESQRHGDAMHVGVERDKEFGGRHPIPSAGIDLVTSHHPAQEKVEPFAGAPPARGRNQEMTSVRKYIFHKSRKGGDYGMVIATKTGHEAPLKGTMLFNDSPHAPEQAGKVLSGREPVFKVREGAGNPVERRVEQKS